MKPIQALLLSMVFIVGCLSGATLSSRSVPRAHAAQSDKWEYFCQRHESADLEAIEVQLNKAGDHGWDLVAVNPASASAAIWCFKRAKDR